MPARDAKVIVNVTRGSVLCTRLIVAETPLARMWGLRGRDSLSRGEGLLIEPARSVHTAFMKFPVDVVFLDAALQVVKLAADLSAWRFASAQAARAVLMVAAHEIARRDVRLDDRLGVMNSEHEGVPLSRGTVLLDVRDRRFASVISMLLSRHGYEVMTRGTGEDVVEVVNAAGVDVVVLESLSSLTAVAHSSAKLRQLCPGIGIVVVSDAPHPSLQSLPVLPKWGAFGELFEAIEQARTRRGVSGRVPARH